MDFVRDLVRVSGLFRAVDVEFSELVFRWCTRPAVEYAAGVKE